MTCGPGKLCRRGLARKLIFGSFRVSFPGGENKKADAGCVLRTEAVHEGSVVEKQCNFIREKKQCKGRGVVTRICLHIWQMEQLSRTDM